MKRLIAMLAVVVAASGCISQGPADESVQPDVNNSAQTSSDGSPNTIYFTGSGFEPSTLTIEKGETVTWIDNSSSSMWVGSDQHPRHTEYDGTSRIEHCTGDTRAFDQCDTGERFSFTFNQTGTWGYHNHEPYVPGGQVVVE